MKESPIYIDEEDDECESEEELSLEIKQSVVEFVLRRFGLFNSSDIARALDWKLKDVNQVLKHLECTGRVKHAKLGRSSVWTPVEERHISPMYY